MSETLEKFSEFIKIFFIIATMGFVCIIMVALFLGFGSDAAIERQIEARESGNKNLENAWSILGTEAIVEVLAAGGISLIIILILVGVITGWGSEIGKGK